MMSTPTQFYLCLNHGVHDDGKAKLEIISSILDLRLMMMMNDHAETTVTTKIAISLRLMKKLCIHGNTNKIVRDIGIDTATSYCQRVVL